MRRNTLIVSLWILPLVGQAYEVEFNCPDRPNPPYFDCSIPQHIEEVPLLELADLGLDKEVVYRFRSGPANRCPRELRQAASGTTYGVELSLELGSQSVPAVPVNFQMNERDLVFVVSETSAPVSLEVSDRDPLATARTPIQKGCKATLELARQSYTTNSLRLKVEGVRDGLKIHAELSDVYQTAINKFNAHGKDMLITIASLRAEIMELRGGLARGEISEAEVLFQEKVKEVLIQAWMSTKDEADAQQKVLEQRLSEALSQGESYRSTALRIMAVLAQENSEANQQLRDQLAPYIP